MPSYAFKDSARKIRITAKEISKNNDPIEKKTKYFCCNPKCGAEMIFVSGVTPYFRAKHRHDENCVYNKVGTYTPGSIDERGFDIRRFIEYTMQPQKDKKTSSTHSASVNTTDKRNLSFTLINIYEMLKYYDYTDYRCGEKIGNMLIDSRSIGCYKDGFPGGKIVEARLRFKKKFYDPKNLKAHLYVSDFDDNYDTELELLFENDDLFKWYRGKFFDKKKPENEQLKNLPKMRVIVSGNWTKDEKTNVHSTKIMNRRQIHVLEL